MYTHRRIPMHIHAYIYIRSCMYMCVYIRASMCVCLNELPIFRSSSKSEITMAILSNKVDFSCSNNEITLKMKNIIVLYI